MATVDQINEVHENISIMCGTGSAVALVSMAAYFMSYEYRDFNRIDLQKNSRQDTVDLIFRRRRKSATAIAIVAMLFYIGGLTLIALSLSLYPSERELQANDISGLIQQNRNQAVQPGVNEAAILAGISLGVVLIGVLQSARDFHKRERFGWVGSTIYAAGWIGTAFAAALNNKSINSLVGNRLAWTLPGAAGIVAGTFLLPWQLENNYVSSPAWPLAALGYVAFTIGTAYVTEAPNIN